MSDYELQSYEHRHDRQSRDDHDLAEHPVSGSPALQVVQQSVAEREVAEDLAVVALGFLQLVALVVQVRLDVAGQLDAVTDASQRTSETVVVLLEFRLRSAVLICELYLVQATSLSSPITSFRVSLSILSMVSLLKAAILRLMFAIPSLGMPFLLASSSD